MTVQLVHCTLAKLLQVVAATVSKVEPGEEPVYVRASQDSTTLVVQFTTPLLTQETTPQGVQHTVDHYTTLMTLVSEAIPLGEVLA